MHVADDGRTVVAVQRWRGASACPRLELRDDVACLVVERAYIGKNRRGALSLAEWIGTALSQVRAGVEVERATARAWRHRVLGDGSLDRTTAKLQAVVAARLYGGMIDPTDDEAEAWCMAHYAWMLDRRGK